MNSKTPQLKLSDNIDNLNATERMLKRAGDVVGSVLLMLVLSPVLLLIYLLLKCDGTDSVVFRQERIGLGGRPFVLLKFRTMCDETEDCPSLAEPDDVRLTRYGRFLRQYHVDELLQLWNVLRGDMSLVGYRPERQYFIDKIMEQNSDYALLFCSRPGITSYAAIYNGYTLTMEQMLRRLDMDLEYLRSRTLWTDVKILFETFGALFGIAPKTTHGQSL